MSRQRRWQRALSAAKPAGPRDRQTLRVRSSSAGAPFTASCMVESLSDLQKVAARFFSDGQLRWSSRRFPQPLHASPPLAY